MRWQQPEHASAIIAAMSSTPRTIPLSVVADAAPSLEPGVRQVAEDKIGRSPVEFAEAPVLRKPSWIRVRIPSGNAVQALKSKLRENRLVTVCEDASCPNIHECFSHGTATFMVMGDVCTRRCSFCDVAHGRPKPLDADEPARLARTVADMGLKYVVITSVDRDDLRDGGAQHFVDCIRKVRELSPTTRIEVLVPDFRGRMDRALAILEAAPPDVMNHNLETAPRLYREARPGSDYAHSLKLLQEFKRRVPGVPTKSGLMVGLGETDDEILAVMRDMREHEIDMLTIGQYLAPSKAHLPVRRYVHPDTFRMFEQEAIAMGFTHAAVGALVRSSYHADQQAHAAGVA
jgi:lipoic acid synthetase